MAEGGVVRRSGRLSLKKQLSKFPAYLLDRPCAESHLGKLVHCITTDTMVLMAADLGLTDVEIDDVRIAWQASSPAVQRLKMFKTWQQKYHSQATYRCVCVKKLHIIA
jgi:hypothetical protein